MQTCVPFARPCAALPSPRVALCNPVQLCAGTVLKALCSTSGSVNRRMKSCAMHLFATDWLSVAASGSVVQALMHLLACDVAHQGGTSILGNAVSSVVLPLCSVIARVRRCPLQPLRRSTSPTNAMHMATAQRRPDAEVKRTISERCHLHITQDRCWWCWCELNHCAHV